MTFGMKGDFLQCRITVEYILHAVRELTKFIECERRISYVWRWSNCEFPRELNSPYIPHGEAKRKYDHLDLSIRGKFTVTRGHRVGFKPCVETRKGSCPLGRMERLWKEILLGRPSCPVQARLFYEWSGLDGGCQIINKDWIQNVYLPWLRQEGE